MWHLERNVYNRHPLCTVQRWPASIHSVMSLQLLWQTFWQQLEMIVWHVECCQVHQFTNTTWQLFYLIFMQVQNSQMLQQNTITITQQIRIKMLLTPNLHIHTYLCHLHILLPLLLERHHYNARLHSPSLNVHCKHTFNFLMSLSMARMRLNLRNNCISDFSLYMTAGICTVTTLTSEYRLLISFTSRNNTLHLSSGKS